MPTATERYFLGLEAGRSARGVHAVLAAMTGSGLSMRARQVRYAFLPYDDAVGRRVLAAVEGEALPTEEAALLNGEVGSAFAGTAAGILAGAGVARRRLAAVGLAGQALAAAPGTACTPLGDPAPVAERTGSPVVSDFARADLAAGGRGRPLNAWPDYVLFHHRRQSTVVADLGRIATLTFLPAGGLPDETLCFEVGPGTDAIDALARRRLGRPFDTDGAVAAGGKAHRGLLGQLLADAHFRQAAPTDCPARLWGRQGAERVETLARRHRLSPADLLATVSEATVAAIATAIGTLTERPHQVILCGGGAKNIYLAMRLRTLLSPASTVALERHDIDAPGKSALGAALLAAARLDGAPANIPAATGASQAVLLGSIR